MKDEKVAREIAEKRQDKLREEVLARNSSTTLEELFSQIQEGEVKELNLIVKGDVQALSVLSYLLWKSCLMISKS